LAHRAAEGGDRVTREGVTPAILVGSLVRVARPVGGGPVNREGHTGRVIDIAGDRHGREALVDYGRGQERWVPLRYLVPASAIFEDHLDVDRAERAHVAEPEGHDEHLDAIEDAIAKARRTPTYDVALNMGKLAGLDIAVIGDIRTNLAARAALVEKGGA
jgi:hypothetical protein